MTMIDARGPSTQSMAEAHNEPNSGLISRKSFATLFRAFWVSRDEELNAHDAASTLFRFFRSNHVLDIQLIFRIAFVVLVAHVVALLVAAKAADHSLTDTIKSLVTYFGPAIPIYGAILAWAYLTASKRLGVVDLFASEIATVCRVGTIFDTGQKYVQKWKRMDTTTNKVIEAKSARSNNFVSKEDYFPIFASNSRDLQSLEALTVGHITEFYTYMKATRDSQRKLAELKTVEAAKETIANIIYTLFLGYESGRNAIEDLIEFQPTRTENMIVVLLTELECYSFLCEHFKGDEVRFERLKLRKTEYERLIRGLVDKVKEPHEEENEKYWAPAERLIPELRARYERALRTVRCNSSH